jgi:membrane associated rhomboid family serine protease
MNETLTDQNNLTVRSDEEPKPTNIHLVNHSKHTHHPTRSNIFKSYLNAFFPFFKFTSLCFAMIILLVGVYIFQEIQHYAIEKRSWECNLYFDGAKYTPAISGNFEFQRLVFPLFLHGHYSHLIFNMISLFLMGFQVESILGSSKFFLLFLLSSIFSFSISTMTTQNTINVGFSSALLSFYGFYLLFYAINYKNLSGTDKFYFILYTLLSIFNMFDTTNKDFKVDVYSFLGAIGVGLILSVCFLSLEGQYPLAFLFRYRSVFLVSYLSTQITLLVLIFTMTNKENTFARSCHLATN